MKFESLHDLYIYELRDLYDAEKRIIKALPKMIEKTSSSDLRDALSHHLEETKGHVTRLEQVFQIHNEDAKAETCDGMKGILSEGEDVVSDSDNPDVRDACIVASCQRVEHYEMAAYGTVRTWAQQMGHNQAVSLLQQTLDEEKKADQKLTQIAERLNPQAVRRAG